MADRGSNTGRGGRGGPGRGRGDTRGPGRGGGRGGSESPSSGGRASPAARGRGGAGGPPFRGRDSPAGGAGYGGRGSSPMGRGGGGGPPPRGGPGGQPFRGGPSARGGPPTVFASGQPTELDPRLLAPDQDALIARFRTLTAVDNKPVRPGWGTLGTPTKLRANFFAVKYPKNAVVYDYTVTITPTTDVKRLRKRIFELLESSPEFQPYLGGVAHDRAQRVVARKLLPSPCVISVAYYEDGEGGPRGGARVYNIEMSDPRELKTQDLDKYLAGDPAFVDYDPLPIISAFNLITSQHAAKHGVPFGKNRFFFPGETFPLSLGIEAWKGYYSSVRPAYKQLMVNVNVCMSAFYVPGMLSDAIMAFQRESRGALPAHFFDKIKVTTRHLGYKARKPIKAIDSRPASKIIFDCEELGGKVSVAQYFTRKYKVTLQHANDLPVVNIGNKTKDNYVPVELCEIEPGQPFMGVLNDRATAEMIKYACNPPMVNATSITQQGLEKLGLRDQESPMDGFNVTVSTEMSVVPARMLPPPTVSYKSGKPRVADGSWNILGINFQQGARLTNYAILVIPDGGREDFTGPADPALKLIIEGFIAKCKASGMAVDPGLPSLRFAPQLPPATPKDPFRLNAIGEIEKVVRTLPRPPTIILILLSGVERHLYPGLKRLFDIKLGIPTVCMLTPKIRKERGQDQYFSNNALKVNVKLGGTNHQLDTESMRWLAGTMLVGMDVTHPGPGTVKGTPSIAAVVASCDNQFTLYPASIRMQKSRQEMIHEAKEMMIERLVCYRKKMKKLPDRVLVYRDGVSEGQFDQVRIHELPGIQAAFRSFDKYKPKLTIIICGKRHHARFYPTDGVAMDKTGNPRAGTVVDRGVTAVYDFDFYLQAHAGLQGTTRPTHYTVVHDENRLSADDIQQGTNRVSYLWARATKSVSLAPPAYWADQAAERARCWLHEILPPAPGSPDARMTEEQVVRRANDLWLEGVHANLRDTMFYL